MTHLPPVGEIDRAVQALRDVHVAVARLRRDAAAYFARETR